MSRIKNADAHLRFLKTLSKARSDKLILLQVTDKLDFENDDSEATQFLRLFYENAEGPKARAFACMLKCIILQRRFVFATSRDSMAKNVRKCENFPEDKRTCSNGGSPKIL